MACKEITKERVSPLFPKRKKQSNKGDYGVCAIVGGSSLYTGAAYLAASSALRGGAGYTYLYAPKKICPLYALKSPELIVREISRGENVRLDKGRVQALLKADCIAFGMGAGQKKGVEKLLCYLLENYTGKLLIDADGLNVLSKKADKEELFAKKKCEVLMTPHLKEFERLCKIPLGEIKKAPQKAAEEFAMRYGALIALKDYQTIVTDGNNTEVFVGGTPAQAKGGSGDVLSGLIASIAATGLSLFDAAVAGVYLAGTAAEIAASKTGEFSLLATDTVNEIGAAFLSLL